MPKKIKIALIGDEKVGKTSFIHRFKMGQFQKVEESNFLPEQTEKSVMIGSKKHGSLYSSSQAFFYQNGFETPQMDVKEGFIPNVYLCDRSSNDSLDRLFIKQKNRCPSTLCSVVFSPSSLGKKHQEELVDITFLDVPLLSNFPLNSLEEWEMDQALGIRSADAFILLYDVTNEKSFEHVKRIHAQILKSYDPSRENGFDKTSIKLGKPRPNSLQQPKSSPETSEDGNEQTSSSLLKHEKKKTKRSQKSRLIREIGLNSLYSASLAHPGLSIDESKVNRDKLTCKLRIPLIVVAGNKEDLCSCNLYRSAALQYHIDQPLLLKKNSSYKRREVSSEQAIYLAKKCWKCHHFGCSVKLDWNVSEIISEILASLLISPSQQTSTLKRLRKYVLKSN